MDGLVDIAARRSNTATIAGIVSDLRLSQAWCVLIAGSGDGRCGRCVLGTGPRATPRTQHPEAAGQANWPAANLDSTRL